MDPQRAFAAAPPPVSVAVLMLTAACDMDCPYCGAEDAFRAMEQAEAEGLCASLASAGVRSVVLGGGEPFCWRGDLRRLAGAAKAAGLEVQVGSNLRRLPTDAPRWPEVDRWVLPLESADPERHDALRPGAPSHYGVVRAGLESFLRAGREVTVSSVARPGAEADLRGVGALLEAQRLLGLRLHAWHLYRFQPMGRHGREHAARFSQDEAQWRDLALGLRARYPGLPLLLRPELLRSRDVAFFWGVPGGIWRQGPRAWSGPAAAAVPLAA
jgi:MoaA/NifB/PqqE/SkfB family radical SAM enzyme